MGDWTQVVDESLGGYFQVHVRAPGRRWVNVTVVRGAMTEIQSFSDADPFGDSTAVIRFPTIGPLDDLDAPDLSYWLADNADVNLFWTPVHQLTGPDDPLAGRRRLMNPLTGQFDVVPLIEDRDVMFEGFFTNDSYDDVSLTMQCQGALFQVDGYKQKPSFPSRPLIAEDMFADAFSRRSRPNLRTSPLRVEFPSTWQVIGARADTTSQTYNSFAPNVQPDRLWTGYSSRNTGGWDAVLTGFIADQLGPMITQADSGVTPGDQWTIGIEHQNDRVPTVPGAAVTSPGRTPVLHIRDSRRPIDFELTTGQPGVKLSLERDMTQRADVVYGEGTANDGTTWRNAVIAADGSATDYQPIASTGAAYPVLNNDAFNPAAMIRESYVKYGSGIGPTEAARSASTMLARNVDPGFMGTITVSFDPAGLRTRWHIRAGMSLRLKHFRGTGETGMRFHIASVERDINSGTVTLRVDTRYRDLVTVEESLARVRDALTPAKLLLSNRASNAIEDIQAPWDYTAGSGFIPKESTVGYFSAPSGDVFPHEAYWKSVGGPRQHPQWFVRCNANAEKKADRWAGPIPILTSEKGTIRRVEMAAYDVDGNVVKVEFALSLYYVAVTSAAMPRDGDGPSPWITGAFETNNPLTGQPWPDGNFLRPDDSFIVGWGNYQQRAGYYPGTYGAGSPKTGVFVDDGTWPFDNTSNPNYNRLAQPGQTQAASAITIYAMVYCEAPNPVWFTGRLYRQPQGS